MNVLLFTFLCTCAIHRVRSKTPARELIRQNAQSGFEALDEEEQYEQKRMIRTRLFTSQPLYGMSKRIGIYLSRPEQVETDEIISKLVYDKKTVFIPKVINEENIDFVEMKNKSDLKELKLNKHGFRAPDDQDKRPSALETAWRTEPYDYDAPDTRRYPDDRGMTMYPPPWTSRYVPPPSLKKPDHSQSHHIFHSSGLDLLIIPGYAFTKDGKRLGGKKGFFSQYVKRCREISKNVTVLGLAWKHQILPSIPDWKDPDIKVDTVLYEFEGQRILPTPGEGYPHAPNNPHLRTWMPPPWGPA